MVDEDVIRKIVQAMDDETLYNWNREVIREVWTRGMHRRQDRILAQPELMSDEDLKYMGFPDESIRLLRLAEKAKKEGR